MLPKKYSIAFSLLLVADLAALFMGWPSGHFAAKVLLMPVLMLALVSVKKAKPEKNWRLILAGLVMAWAGDVLLLFAGKQEIFFILGLVCFLLTHFAYILYFSRYHNGLWLYIKSHWLACVAVFAYAVVLLAILLPHLGALTAPVIVYTLVITLMVLQSLALKNGGQTTAGSTANLFVAGALLFIVSDSLLALNKFYYPFPLADVGIMLTYGLAQWLIVLGAGSNADGAKQS